MFKCVYNLIFSGWKYGGCFTGKIRFFYIAGAISFLFACSSCEVTTRIYLVRHAERQTGVNPHLTDAGNTRALTLKDTLSTKSINMVLTTDSNRTRETAQPTATFFNLPLTLYRKDTIPGLVRRLKNLWGKNILLVTHSETIPLIMQEFGLSLGISTPITGFNNLIIIKRKKAGQLYMSHTETMYGNPP
jgi:phosphohistidine phosphatase SixA